MAAYHDYELEEEVDRLKFSATEMAKGIALTILAGVLGGFTLMLALSILEISMGYWSAVALIVLSRVVYQCVTLSADKLFEQQYQTELRYARHKLMNKLGRKTFREYVN